MTLWDCFGAALIAMILSLLAGEWRVWDTNRRLAPRKHNANRRFLRRMLGGALLLSVLLVLRFPSPEGLPQNLLLLKLLLALFICCMVFLVVIYDVRSVTREVREESAQDLHEYLTAAAHLRQLDPCMPRSEAPDRSEHGQSSDEVRS